MSGDTDRCGEDRLGDSLDNEPDFGRFPALKDDDGNVLQLHLPAVNTGENGIFTADEFAAITTPGQMHLITAEDVARTVVMELLGGSTGHDAIAALDGAVSGPTTSRSTTRPTCAWPARS